MISNTRAKNLENPRQEKAIGENSRTFKFRYSQKERKTFNRFGKNWKKSSKFAATAWKAQS